MVYSCFFSQIDFFICVQELESEGLNRYNQMVEGDDTSSRFQFSYKTNTITTMANACQEFGYNHYVYIEPYYVTKFSSVTFPVSHISSRHIKIHMRIVLDLIHGPGPYNVIKQILGP
jgi:hypothetical protein